MEYSDVYSQPLRLTYSLHSKTMMESIQSCQRRLCYTDVQLISEGGTVFAHSIVLAGASNFLKHLLISNPDPVIVIHLPGVDYEPLRLLLEVLYGGEELQLTLKQVVALQDLGSLLHIDMCNSAAMEQAFLQASQEGVLTIPGSFQQHSSDTIQQNYEDESSPNPTPQPPMQNESVRSRSHTRTGNSPGKAALSNNNNNNNTGGPIHKKRRSAGQQHQKSPSPMAPFSLLSNVDTPGRTGGGNKRTLANDGPEQHDMGEDGHVPQAPPPKKLSRAAQKEMVTCRECRTPFKLIVQLNHHMTREGHLFPPCPECNIAHVTLESLIAHVDVHPPETVFTCKYCQKGVLGHDRYLYHMLMCKSLIRGDYVCFICRKSFRNSGSLKTHLLLHTGAKPFPCNYCSASFRQRHHRSHHERSVHLMQGGVGGVPVEQQTETSPANDAEHVPATPQSDGSRPFPCGFCNAAFRQSNHRSYHERVIHGVDRRTRSKGGPAVPLLPAGRKAAVTGKVTNNGSARKSVSRPVGNSNGFTPSPSVADAEAGGEDEEEAELEEEDVDAEADDLVEEDMEEEADDVDAEVEDEVVDEDIAGSVEAEDEEQAPDEEEEGEDEEEAADEEDEDVEPVSPSNKVDSDVDE